MLSLLENIAGPLKCMQQEMQPYKGTKLGENPDEDHGAHCLQDQLVQPMIKNPDSFTGNTIFYNVAYKI